MTAGQRGPRLEIVATAGSRRWRLLETGAPFKRDEMTEAMSDEGTVLTRVTPHWSPDGNQVVLVVAHQPQFDSNGFLPSAHVYLRTLGPQIKVVAAGADPIELAGFLGKLREQKVPLVQFESLTTPSPARKVYYRRNAQAVAKEIAGWVPGKAAVEKLSKDGWVDIIVFMGIGS